MIDIDERNDKTYLRNTAFENRLNRLAIIKILVHRDVTVTADEEIEILATDNIDYIFHNQFCGFFCFIVFEKYIHIYIFFFNCIF